MAGTIDSWLLYKLSGMHATDYTNASRTMLFNILKKQWDEELLEIFNIPANILPTVYPSSYVYTQVNTIPELNGIPIASLVGDQQAALFGQLCTKKGQAKNTYGTGCFLLLNTENECVFSKSKLLTTLACDEFGKPVFALEGSAFIGGAVMQWLRDKLEFFSQAEESSEMIASLENDVDGIVFVPAFTGLACPHWDMQARGALLGLTRDTSKAQITRAALKAIAFQSYDLVKAMEMDLKMNIGKQQVESKIKVLNVDGGASSNNYLMQFQADILNATIAHPKNLNTTALGAAYLTGIACKLWTAKDLKQFQSNLTTYKSKMSKTRRELELGYWHRGVSRSLDWNID